MPQFLKSLCARMGAALVALAPLGVSAADTLDPLPAGLTLQETPVVRDASTRHEDELQEPELWSLHGQATGTEQVHPPYHAPYSGGNSLASGWNGAETVDITLFAGLRLWHGAAAYMDPEIDQGFGLSNTLGFAAFPSGEAYKIGYNFPYFRLPRAFVRQVIDTGSEHSAAMASSANELAESVPENNLTLTAGKLAVVDIFDTNRYAHDPRADFLNWAVVDAGAFDYAADSWGFTYGLAAEWTQSWWTLRAGVFALSKIPNSRDLEGNFRQYSEVVEFEERHDWGEHPGKLKLLAFDNRGRMGGYDNAIAYSLATGGQAPDTANVRVFSSRPGVVLNLEQALRPDLGVFARASYNDGSKETYEFTDIDKSLQAGLSWQGDSWGRSDDTLGAALVVSGLSAAAQRYFSDGGLGVLIGDGRLDYGLEKAIETYYAWHAVEHLTITADYQLFVNPAYNKDRGPVSVIGLRVHAEF